MIKDKIQTGIRFEQNMLNKISFIAKHNKRSLNAQLEFLVQKCVDKFEDEHGEVKIDIDD